ncbi:metal ABC transporter solute-binding protein, Zn/Mn family [Chelativorans sp. J32]|uniref:metal ABC transporter solute-binding protein, Zn/Mn family n=1 Tax=Chelativorans sp. J32 TaxID=935840 RepID=UPI0004829A21|nr:zinc ABC transporter substrate-binding protein [Chelativorans sp. J32]
MADRARRWLLVMAGLLALAPVFPSMAQEKLKVVATTGMIADAARQVGGDLVDVQGLMGPGVDPHSYRQTRTDILAMTKADLVLWHGLYLEAQMEDFMKTLSSRRRVVAVADDLPHDLLLSHDQYKSRYDPHVWMDPELWSRVVAVVRDSLIEARPEGEAQFRANAEKHLQDIAALSDYSKEVLASVPAESRILVTAHDAFKYFGRAYGYDVLGIQGISTQSEAGLSRIAELVDVLVKRKIRAVFVESSVSDRNVRALVEGAASKGWKVEVGGQLFSDALGPGCTYEGTYIGMIDHNVTTITRALGGHAAGFGEPEVLVACS